MNRKRPDRLIIMHKNFCMTGSNLVCRLEQIHIILTQILIKLINTTPPHPHTHTHTTEVISVSLSRSINLFLHKKENSLRKYCL